MMMLTITEVYAQFELLLKNTCVLTESPTSWNELPVLIFIVSGHFKSSLRSYLFGVLFTVA